MAPPTRQGPRSRRSPAQLTCLLQAQHNRAARNGTVLENDEVPPEYSENRRGQRALVALRSQACQAFYQLPVASGGSLVWDESAHLFRHKAEMPTNYFGPELPYASFRRMLTYEDVAVKPNFSRATEPCQAPGCRDVFESLDYCLPYAVHGAQRPIKVNYLEVGSEKSLLAAAVWKCASTSLTDALWKVSNTTRFMGPHWKNLSDCGAQGHLPGCSWTTTFSSGVTDARWKIATFRHPLDRFVASVNEHVALPSCDGMPCVGVVQQAQHQAERLLRDFPGQWRSCEHATQSYFLSATDLQYGIWLIVQGFVGDFGYCGKLGVVTGYVSCILGVICIVASAFDIKSTRMRNIEKAYPMPAETDDEDEVDAPAPRVAAGGPVAGAPSGSMGPNAVNDLFDKLDTDGDGVLSAAELRSGGFR